MNPLLNFQKNWLIKYSNSYGADELYHGLTVAEKIFPHSSQSEAEETFEFLKKHGVDTVKLREIVHTTDNQSYFYVYSEVSQFIKFREEFLPEIEIISQEKSPSFLERILSFLKF